MSVPLAPLTRVHMSDGCGIVVKVLDSSPTNALGQNKIPKPLFIVQHSAVGASDHKETEASYGFLAEFFRVLVFDARGCGGSGKLEDVEGGWELSHRRWVEDVDELRAWAGASTFYLAGNSYGAVIALEYALVHPKRLDGLILRAGLIYGPLMAENALRRVENEHAVDFERQKRLWSGSLSDAVDFEAALGEIGGFFGYHSAEKLEHERRVPDIVEVEERKTEERNRENVGGKQERDDATSSMFYETHNAAFGTCLPNFDGREKLREIKARSLVVVGRHDWLTPVEGSAEIVEGINAGGGEAKLVVFEESGHDPTTEERHRWRSVIVEWLREGRNIEVRE